MNFEKLFSSHSKIVVELGFGDGRVLESLAKNDRQSLYIGIETSRELCDQARSRIMLDNVMIIKGSFEKVILNFQDESIDRFMIVLPDPDYIDEKKQDKWALIYKVVHSKMKDNGTLQLVTEMTDELLRPVSDSIYSRWSGWLGATFLSIGFLLLEKYEGSPAGYFSRCLDQFKGDPERIRILTLEMEKQ